MLFLQQPFFGLFRVDRKRHRCDLKFAAKDKGQVPPPIFFFFEYCTKKPIFYFHIYHTAPSSKAGNGLKVETNKRIATILQKEIKIPKRPK